MVIGIGRREFIAGLGGSVATWPLAARAQQPERLARIGYLSLGSSPLNAYDNAFLAGFVTSATSKARTSTSNIAL
jgi:hypothetical protein